MALVKRYQGKPVKHMRRVEGGILLTFYAPIAGQPGPQQVVSQVDWDRLGEERTVPDAEATGAVLRQMSE